MHVFRPTKIALKDFNLNLKRFLFSYFPPLRLVFRSLSSICKPKNNGLIVMSYKFYFVLTAQFSNS